MRPVAALLALLLSGSTVLAQNAPTPVTPDPAVAACEAALRHEFPLSDISPAAADIAQNRVTLVVSTGTSAMIFTRQCVFTHDAATASWTLRDYISPRDAYGFEASSSCHATEGWAGVLRRSGKPEQADLARARLEECGALLRAPEERKREVAAQNARVAVGQPTPIAAGRTALRQP